jgi:S1-C subfamily serine protease
MKHLFASLALALIMLVPVNAADTPVPQAVRVVVEDSDTYFSAGTGTLIRADLIITNNHVVVGRAKNGKITVKFPSGLIYVGKVVKVDKVWDLAAIRINPVDIPPMPLGDLPATGDMITVGGYGSGDYKVSAGELTAWFLPDDGSSVPGFLEVKTTVRPGDSGGAMVMNGELVGVLFGCDDTYTYGASSLQVKKFLEGIE